MLRKLMTLIFVFSGLAVICQNALPVVQSCNDFAFQVYKQESLIKPNSNYSFSPLSLNISLRMLAAGARTNTLEQIKKLVALDEDPLFIHSNIKDLLSQFVNDTVSPKDLLISNAIWIQKDYPINQDFIQIIGNLYHTNCNTTDFVTPLGRDKSKTEINKWVANETNGKILNLIDDKTLNPNSRLVFVDAMYFKALWQKPFDKQRTQSGDFTNISDKTQKCLFMQQSNTFDYMVTSGFQAIDIPYNNQFSLLIVLPDQNQFNEIDKRIDSQLLDSILNNFEPKLLELRIPKLKLESSDDYADHLKMLGMEDAFGNQADFSGITGNKELYVSKIIQKCNVEMDEQGTEASAATAVVMSRKMASVSSLYFNANRPFIYLIRDRQTGTILFMGKYVIVN